MSTASIIFLQAQMEQICACKKKKKSLDLVIVLGKLSCKSFQEFYAPFLLNSFLEHVPILHIHSFFNPPNSGARIPCLSF